MAFRRTKDRIEYFVACVTEFADAFDLDYQKSFDYLDRHCGMDFLMQCYEAEHTVSFTDAVSDLLDKFEDDGEATPEDFAKTIVDGLLGEGGGDAGSAEEPEGEVVDIADLEKGDRVAVWWNDDNQAWFTGEVASVKRGKVTVKYDDDTEGVLEPELHTIIKRIEE